MNRPETATASQPRPQRTQGFGRQDTRSRLLRLRASNAPLSLAQEWIWSIRQMAPGLPFCNRTLVLQHAGRFSPDAIRRAIIEVVQRHEAWRTTIGTENGEVRQIVCAPAQLTLPVTDLQGLSDAEREITMRRLIAEEASRPLPVDTAPMVRCRLLKLHSEQHVLVVTVHELISDSASLGLFLQEVTTLYEAFATGRPSPFSSLPVQYGDFAFWQRTQLNEQRGNEHSAQQPRNTAEAAVLPTDWVQTGTASFRGRRHGISIRKELRDGLKRLSEDQQATLQLSLLAAFHVLISRYTDQDDIVIGSTNELRKRPELQELLGRFAMPLVMRTDLSGDPNFREVLQRVKESQSRSCEHRYAASGALSENAQSGAGNSQRLPFRLLFSFEPGPPALAAEWKVLEFNAETGISPHDLSLTLQDGNEISGHFTYKADLFEPATIARMAGHLETLLEGIAGNPEASISRLPLLTEKERQQIVVQWNDTSVPYSPDLCLHELVEARAQISPDAVAVIAAGGQLTYAELNGYANQLARVLQANGIGPEIPVPICLERSLDMTIAVLGVLKAGGACCLLDPKYPPERLAFMLQDLQAPVLITKPGMVPSTAIAQAKVLDVESLLKNVPPTLQNLAAKVTPQSLAFVIYTSGSTGKPKGALLPHRALAHYNTMTARQYEMGLGDRYLQFSSPSFDVAVEEIFATWISGAALVLRSQETSFSLSAFLDEVERFQVSVVNLPAAFWHEWVHQMSELATPIPNCMRVVVVGGEKPFHASLLKWFTFAKSRVRWINAYGPTEASISSATFEPDPKKPPESLVPIGRALPNTRLYILDRYLNVVPVGVPGELHIGGIGLARGYLNRPEITAEKFIPDPFSNDPGARLYKSGDIARYLPTGEIDCLGRKDDQVKLRGFRIELGEIEEVLSAHAGVVEAAVVVRQAESGDKRLVAFIVPANADKFTPDKMRDYVRQKLPEYMVPAEFVTLPAMPLTPAGKVDRRRLPVTITRAVSSNSLPKDALEAKLTGIWEEVLSTSPIGTDQHFFELGGHSLLAARLMYRIEQALGKRLPIALLFQAPTIASFAALLRQKEWQPSWSSLVPMQTLGSRPPFFCVHGVGGNIIGFGALAARMQPEQPFYGLQAQGLDGNHPCHASVAEMASHYISEMRKIQPRGPYYIGGFSFGGLVAYEIARQLTARDESIGSLILLDTYTAKLTSKTVSLANILFSDHRKELLSKLPATLKKSLRRRFTGWQLPANLKRVREACSRAASVYVLQPYGGAVTLFCAREQSLRSANGMYSGWAALAAGGVDVHEITGDHNGMLREPQVAALAAELKSCLEAAQSAYTDERRAQAV